jgi:hypothetical protein
MWMRNFALAIQNGKNGNQRQQGFTDAPAQGCQPIVKPQDASSIFQSGICRCNTVLIPQHASSPAVSITVSFNPADQWFRITQRR